MIRSSSFVVALTLAVASAAVSVSASASASASSLEAWAKARIQANLLQPLAKKEESRSRFSRAAPPPTERRVRVLASALSQDAKGRGFLPYAIDARYGDDEWSETYVGCIYDKTGLLFVAVGDEHRPAAFLLGKKADAVPGACQVALPADRS